jgi:hypothetical protein
MRRFLLAALAVIAMHEAAAPVWTEVREATADDAIWSFPNGAAIRMQFVGATANRHPKAIRSEEV